MNVGFIGIGKLGMACAEVMANQHSVTGYDIYRKNSDVIKIADTLSQAVVGQDIIFIAVQTPHDPDYSGSAPTSHLPNVDFDYTAVETVLKQVNCYVRPNQLVVLISTVLPGTTRERLRPLITNGRFIYNPYLIAMGSVEWDMVNPEMVIIGTEDGSITGAAAELIEFYRGLMQNDPRYEVGTWDEAECIKVFYNTFISAKISLVNMIQDVAIKQGNINVDVVTNALAKSSMRIMGPKYMTAGLGDAGPCVLPSFKLTVNGNVIAIGDLYDTFTEDTTFLVESANYACSIKDEKKIAKVTKTNFDGEMLKFTTSAGELVVTPNHLLPINRNGKRLLVPASEVRDTDKLYKL
jgi:UDPglucose 6-dehydrogenase